MFCCLVLCDVGSVVLLPVVVVIVWLNSKLFNLVVTDVCEVVYMVWDIQWVVMCVLYVCMWGKWWATVEGRGRPE